MSRPLQLQTERLILRLYKPSDIPTIVRLIGAREIAATTLRIPHPYTERDARTLLRRFAKERPPTHFGIFLRETGEHCGGAGLNIEPDHDRAELGYWIGLPYWGKGIASEAAQEVVRFGFETLELHRIYANCFVGNDASAKILLKLGMRHEGRLRQHFKKWDEYRDSDNYGLLLEEWRAARR